MTLIQTFKFYFLIGVGIILLCPTLSAQEMITGYVYDKITQQPIEGAIAGYDETGRAKTDSKGIFSIPLISIQNQKSFTFSALGYKTISVTIDQPTNWFSIGLDQTGYSIEEVHLSAFASGKKLIDQIGGISFIPKADLERDPQLIITPALNRIPGVYMHSGAYNTNRITIRGIGSRSLFSTNKVRAYLDEIPLTNGIGETTIEDVDLSLIDRVEIIKGPSSSIYGAGLGGSINLSTTAPDYKKGSVSSELMIGSYGVIRNATTFENSNGSSHITLNYNNTHSDGYRENNQYDRQSFTFMGQFYPGKNDRISVIAGLVSVKAFIPSSIDSATFADEPTSAAFTWNKTQGFEDYDRAFVGISHRHQFENDWEHSLSFFGSFRNAWEPRPFNILGEESQNIGLRNRLSKTGELAEKPYTFSIGGEFFREWYNWQTYENINGEGGLGGILSNNLEDRIYYNIFSQFEWYITPKTRFILGANLNQTNYELTDRYTPDSTDISGSYGFAPIISPRIGINHKISNQIAIHAGISHGFSPPSLEETLTPDGAINPDIQPETGWNFELGSRGRIVNGRLFYDISLYSMQIQNLLVARRTSFDQFIGINAGKTAHNGLELALNYQLINTANKRKDHPRDYSINAFLSYTYAHYRFSEFEDNEQNYAGNELTGTPPHVFNAGLDFKSKIGFYGNINFMFVDAMPMRDDNSIYSDAYSLLNTKFGFRKNLFSQLELDINGGINNIADTHYASMILVNASSFGGRAPRYFYPGLPRNYYASIALKWLIHN